MFLEREINTMWPRGYGAKGLRGYRCVLEWQGILQLSSLRFQGEFCCYSDGFYLCFVGCQEVQISCARGKHMRTKKSSHPCGCCEFAGVRSPVLIRISSSCDITVNSQDSVIFSGLLTEKSDLRSCFCVLTIRLRGGVRFVLKQ